jgi:hypothetical protein
VTAFFGVFRLQLVSCYFLYCRSFVVLPAIFLKSIRCYPADITQLEPLPDLTSLLRPSRWGDVAASIFFSAGGLFIGGESGLLIGSYSAQHTIMRDDKSNNRIKDAFRKFRIDVLKRDLARLESNTTVGPDERGHLGGIF